ncbi:MAG: pyridoxal-phosphate dependent enzyme [Ignavibacteriales bacterium]|nr:pyridoxal-phosphate dependent enzyme [Ignavibacteriales bacterium]MCF8314842.1 pyridoxal-phosphate dependent enzyme [Ignavibacteriales bacterium]MCF8436209.1 pyridoxal-phosphate dependent enzyme [Ignavibacteriales bacterium]
MINSHFLRNIPTKSDIKDAHLRIKEAIHKTPVLESSAINKEMGCRIYFKCENLQKVGAFKYRGASNALLSLNKEDLKNGVATHSSGNHAAALALAARSSGARAYIVMPETAPEIKKKVVASYGAEIIYCAPTLEARETTLEGVIAKTGAIFVHPYNNYTIIAGQATAAKEIIEEIGNSDFLLAPVGGGGLLSGSVLSAEYFGDKISVIGCEPKGADDAFRSIRDGVIYPSVNPKTISDGLLTSLGDKTFNILRDRLHLIMTVEEHSIITAMRMIWERMKIIIEPSSAVPFAAIMENREVFTGKTVSVILSGGNVDLESLPWSTANR